MIELTQGDILRADAEALVNTVNCVGVMGRGIALQFRKAFPENYKAYKAVCERGELRPGVPGSSLGPSATAVEQMIADPDRLEPGLLRGARDRGNLRPADLALHLGKLNTDAHGERRYRREEDDVGDEVPPF